MSFLFLVLVVTFKNQQTLLTDTSVVISVAPLLSAATEASLHDRFSVEALGTGSCIHPLCGYRVGPVTPSQSDYPSATLERLDQ